MPDKYLIEFLADWIRDDSLRCRILHREVQEMAAEGLTAQQSSDLRSLEKTRILGRLVKELEDELGIDLQRILDDFNRTGPLGGGGGAAGAVYDEGRTHVRGVEPESIPSGVETDVEVRGHGWDDSLEIFFEEAGGGARVDCALMGMICDVDVYQKAKVKVRFDTPGSWRVVARVASNSPTDSDESVLLEVT